MEAVAVHNFNARKEDELSVKKGAIITVLIADKEVNWSLARLNEKTGLVPKTFFRLKPIVGYMGYTNRGSAEGLLRRDHRDNSFLLRESDRDLGNFALSVKYKGEIEHYKIFINEDKEYLVSDRTFPTINSLMQYHRTHSIIKQDSDILLDQPILEASKFKVNTTFKSHDPEELSFEKGDTVTVTDFSDLNWWVGQCEERMGMFPVPYIEPVLFPSRRKMTARHSVA